MAYDALWDHERRLAAERAIAEGRTIGDLRFVPEPGATLAAAGPAW